VKEESEGQIDKVEAPKRQNKYYERSSKFSVPSASEVPAGLFD